MHMSMPVYSQFVEFSVDPRQQAQLAVALNTVDEQFTCTCPGFISASVQASEDGQRVLHQVWWQSREACEAALRHLEAGVPDVQALIRQHRVQAARFSSYRMAGQVAARA
ncbi:antibiotic biosynthesis monooxygenase [Pseudomonas syringae]|nr:antibiotic biosynthesis monooxygenase [Pseudomonas syringae]MBD8574140.1 antibiotic biosynthesis monooxygenase [Pseudomonas syringae]MBD8791076.1 antibiotic biosynthesis monooxygenase [Pseudomonas syringae]MBD8801322.1 antibiotic biosynthesis monooxygenase [Pseudomonas syringae]MBD8810401.1 antibiotic biosynthesis monooxygenase [Pseudomonas syringae]